jgi:hypothetical protein
MAEIKTKPTDQNVQAFLDRIEDERKRDDAKMLVKLMQEVTGAEPQMFGESIVGFGKYRYRNASGINEWFAAGFSPRKAQLVLYLMGLEPENIPGSLGKFTTGKSCLYVKKISDVDQAVLKALVQQSIDYTTKVSAELEA